MRWTKIAIIFLFISFAILMVSVVWQSQRIGMLEKKIKADTTKTLNTNDITEHYELAVVMGRLQLYMNKLWFAAQGKHWDLAFFYYEEIEETVEALRDENPLEDGIEIGKLANTWLLKNIDPLEKAIENKDAKAFKLQYKNVIINCNGCHVSAKHPFIKIKIPESPVFNNQFYSIQ